MKIAQKLTLLLVSSIILLSSLLGIGLLDKQQVSYIHSQKALISDLQVLTLQMRRNEKNFIQRLDVKDIETYNQNYRQLSTLLTQFDTKIVGDVGEFKQAISAYYDSFIQLTNKQKQIGLTPEDGLYGSLRISVHNIESALNTVNHDELMVEMLLLRRHEKDLMLRNDLKYEALFNKTADKFLNTLKAANLDESLTTKITSLMKAYQADFNTLIDNKKIIGSIAGSKGIKQDVSNHAAEAESALEKFTKIASNNEQIIESKNQLIAVSFSLIATIIMLSIVLWTRRGVLAPLTLLSEQVLAITQQMRFNQPISYTAQDEMGDLARALNALFAALDKGVCESNLVISAIAAGNMTQRVTGNYVGDLAALQKGINESADNIAKVIESLSYAMSSLSSGNFNIAINTQASGDYGVMLSHAANSMSALNHVINDMNLVMAQMNEGDFNARVNAQANGDLLSMKDNVNNAMDRLAMAVSGISGIMTAQADGDLTRECAANFKGQLKDLQTAINQSSRKLKEIVSDAVQASTIVSCAADQVSQGSSDLSSRVQEQAATLEQTCSTMNEMASAVQNNTANARKVAELTHQVKNQSTDGAAVMQQTISAMQSIRESSSKIAEIVTLIDSIAFQTNLLALNAAVEAARAGEHGRGFAVVASEVRALAGKSADAAKDIKGLIEDSVNRIHAGTTLADKSGEMLNGITTSIEQVAEMIEHIAEASKEQTVGINQVHLAIADIDKVTQENAALVEETTAAADSLSSEANNLRNNMAFFKTGDTIGTHAQSKAITPIRKQAALPAPQRK